MQAYTEHLGGTMAPAPRPPHAYVYVRKRNQYIPTLKCNFSKWMETYTLAYKTTYSNLYV